MAIHLLLAALLFFLVNWLGRHSISSGYHQITLFENVEDAPGFNMVFRVITPVFFLVITAAAWYGIGLDEVVRNYWLVTAYYFLGRWFFNIAIGRTLLIKWTRQFAIAALSVSISYVAYRVVLHDRRLLLPDPKQLRDQLWILVILFLYSAWNRVAIPSFSTYEERRQRYLKAQYFTFRKKFGCIIERESGSRPVEALSYAVLVYESFNRPPLYQFLESHILFPLGLSRSVGPMQVRSDERIRAEEGVVLGVRKLRRDFATSWNDLAQEQHGSVAIGRRRDPIEGIELEQTTPEGARLDPDQLMSSYDRQKVVLATAGKYNVRSDYPREIQILFNMLIGRYFADLTDKWTDRG